MTPQQRLESLAASLEDLRREIDAASFAAKQAAQAAKAAREHVATLEARYEYRLRQHADAYRARLEEERLSGLCEPVWITPPSGGWRSARVTNVEGGQFVLVGVDRVQSRWWIRTGYEVGASAQGARLDGPATLAAWRAWCAAQREALR